VDYSVGGRYAERARGGAPPYQTRLAALRWPERELAFDDGERILVRSTCRDDPGHAVPAALAEDGL